MISGNYVKTFAEASHALPDGMSMNADYPFMLPRIVRLDARSVTLKGSRGVEDKTVPIVKRNGREVCSLAQSSTYEIAFRSRPTVFWFYPFKDENTPAIGSLPANTEANP